MKASVRKIHRAAVLAASLSLALAGTASADIKDTITRTFTVAPGGTLTISSNIGSIRVEGSGDNTVKVDVVRDVGTSNEKRAKRIFEDLDINIQQRGNDVSVEAKYNRNFMEDIFRFFTHHLRVEFVVSVPRVYNADLKTSGGSISVLDVQGEVRSRTSGGSLKFDGITGPLFGNTSGGSIQIGEVNGKVEVRTSGGSIKIDKVSDSAKARTSGGSIRIKNAGGDVYAHTSGGGITIDSAAGEIDAHTSGGSISIGDARGTVKADTSGGSVKATLSAQPKSDCSLSTSGGSVTVSLAEGIAVDVDAKASGGRVATEYPVTVQGEIGKRSLQAKINGGGPLLRLRASGGGIHLKKK